VGENSKKLYGRKKGKKKGEMGGRREKGEHLFQHGGGFTSTRRKLRGGWSGRAEVVGFVTAWRIRKSRVNTCKAGKRDVPGDAEWCSPAGKGLYYLSSEGRPGKKKRYLQCGGRWKNHRARDQRKKRILGYKKQGWGGKASAKKKRKIKGWGLIARGDLTKKIGWVRGVCRCIKTEHWLKTMTGKGGVQEKAGMARGILGVHRSGSAGLAQTQTKVMKFVQKKVGCWQFNWGEGKARVAGNVKSLKGGGWVAAFEFNGWEAERRQTSKGEGSEYYLEKFGGGKSGGVNGRAVKMLRGI